MGSLFLRTFARHRRVGTNSLSRGRRNHAARVRSVPKLRPLLNSLSHDVSTGSVSDRVAILTAERDRNDETRSLPLPVLTSSGAPAIKHARTELRAFSFLELRLGKAKSKE